MLTRTKDGAMRTFSRAAAICAAVLAALVMLVPATGIRAQDGPAPDWNDPVDTMEGAVGLHYGRVGGHGLSFRVPLKWWLYLQTTGGIWHTSERKRHNLGFELNYILRQDRATRIYIGAGTAYFYDDEMTGTVDGAEVWDKDTHWNTGFGVGAELLRGRRWSMMIEGDFMHDGKTGDTTVVPQAGIYYYW
jgi:hypothetical protein